MVERKYLAHYLDAAFGGEETDYTRLGRHLEEYSEELNPDVEVTKNIIGEQSVVHNGYEVQAEVSPFYFDSFDDKLTTSCRTRSWTLRTRARRETPAKQRSSMCS